MRLPLCYPIESRDGTLNADAKMKNMVVEEIEGERVAVKRPGVTSATQLPSGQAQGLFNLNGMAYSIVNDTLYGTLITGGGGSVVSGWSKIADMPFGNGWQNPFIATGSGLIFLDEFSSSTWTCTNPTTWTNAPWSGNWFPTNLLDQVYFGGYLWNWYAYGDNLTDFGKSSNGIAWALNRLASDVPEVQFFYEQPIVHAGAIVRFWINPTTYVVYVCRSTDGTTWTEWSATNLSNASWKFISYAGNIYLVPGNKSVYRSSDNGSTWTLLTSNWGISSTTMIDCIATTSGLMAVFTDKKTWTSTDGITWTLKNYTLPVESMVGGQLAAIGTDLYMIGSGASFNTVFKLLGASTPQGIPL